MPRAAARKDYRNFTGGLHTESSALSYPENVSKDLDNVDLFRDGSVKRRRALVTESSYSLSAASFTDSNLQADALTTYEWHSVDGDDTLNFIVMQIGDALYFHQLGASVTSDSLVGSVDISSLALNSSASLEPLDYASGKGALFIVGEYYEPAYITYDSDSRSFSLTQLSLKIRDFEGVDDNLDIDERPTSLSTKHKYNLLNQGWLDNSGTKKIWVVVDPVEDATPNVDPLEETRSQIGAYPSNADIWYMAKTSAARRPYVIGTYYPHMLEKYSFGNTKAPKGHFILDAFNRNRDTASGLSGLYEVSRDKDDVRPLSVAFYAGRVWYLMPDGRLLYSQVIEQLSDAALCYQSADPSAEDINELVATDGGKLDLNGMARGLKLMEIGHSLLVFADNGVWVIAGSDGNSFSATAHSIEKITDVGCISRDSVVGVEGIAFFWSPGGIYLIGSNEVSGSMTAQNLTEETIQTFYEEDIPELGKRFSRGKYSKRNKRVYWLYNDDASYDGTNDRFLYNKILIFDIVLKAFYKYSIPYSTSYPKVSALVETESYSFSTTEEDVTDGGVTVTDSSITVTSDVVSTSASGSVKLKVVSFGDPSLMSSSVNLTQGTVTVGAYESAPLTQYGWNDFDEVWPPGLDFGTVSPDPWTLGNYRLAAIEYYNNGAGTVQFRVTIADTNSLGDPGQTGLFTSIMFETATNGTVTLDSADATSYGAAGGVSNPDGYIWTWSGTGTWSVDDVGETHTVTFL